MAKSKAKNGCRRRSRAGDPGQIDRYARLKPGARKEQSAARRDAILQAAPDEFSALRGFAATRLEDLSP